MNARNTAIDLISDNAKWLENNGDSDSISLFRCYSHFVHSSFCRTHKHLQEALVSASSIYHLAKGVQKSKIDSYGQLAVANVLWDQGDRHSSMQLLRQSIDAMPVDKQTGRKLDEARRLAQLVRISIRESQI